MSNERHRRPEGQARRRGGAWVAALLLGVAATFSAELVFAEVSAETATEAAFGLIELTQLLRRETAATAIFHELQYRRVLKAPLERRGELRFEPPDLLEKRVLAPVIETYRLQGETLSITLPARRTRQLSMRNQPLLGGLLLGFKAIVSGQLELLGTHFETAVSGSAAAWQLDLRPVRPEVARYIESIAVTGHGPEPLRIEVLERSGDRTVTDIEPR